MDKASKKELLSIIAKQEEELNRYRTRFQDVVAAHKRLLKEKEALELSLKALSKTSSHEIPIDSTDEEIPSNTKHHVEASPKLKRSSEENDSTEELRVQLNTLMNSIATLSEEKSKMEAMFQADRKQARTEKEEKEKIIKDLQKQLEQAARSQQNELENYKSKLIVERHQREKEHNDHGVMIRELQKLVAEERTAREAIETGAESVRREWTQYRTAAEHRERELSNTVESLRRKLKREKESATPLLSTLQEEMGAMKQQHSIALLREQQRAAEAEGRARKLAAVHEERVANLEARLAELSQTVGSYDRLRQNDQEAIQKLKDRLVQLELEQGAEKGDADLEDIVEKFQHLKQRIEMANITAEKRVDLKGILKDWQDSMMVEGYTSSDHSLCHEEYSQLKREFEAYKQQTTVMSSALMATSGNNIPVRDDCEPLKAQVTALRERVSQLTNELEQTQADHKLLMEEQKNELKKERALWKEKLATTEHELRGKLSTLEEQLSKQRERALALMQEKEQEIAALKTSCHSKLPTRRFSLSSDNDGSVNMELDTDGRHMLHFAHEAARYQVDVAKLRKQNHRLETTLRDTQRAAAEERVAFNQRIKELLEQVDRLERCQSREGANLEYLKNVVLSYLVSSDTSCKAHMLNAIAAVLKFSDQEQQRVRQTSWYNRSGSLA